MKPWKRMAPPSGARPPRRLQWGHGDEAVEEREDLWALLTTMTLQWGHGDEAVEEPAMWTLQDRSKSGFNGATAMKPWKRRGFAFASRARAKLQWGHGDEAVEEPELLGVLPGEFWASMGPRR